MLFLILFYFFGCFFTNLSVTFFSFNSSFPPPPRQRCARCCKLIKKYNNIVIFAAFVGISTLGIHPPPHGRPNHLGFVFLNEPYAPANRNSRVVPRSCTERRFRRPRRSQANRFDLPRSIQKRLLRPTDAPHQSAA